MIFLILKFQSSHDSIHSFKFPLLCPGHRRHPWKCPPGLFHHSKEGTGWSTPYFLHVLQLAQTTQLQQEEHPARQAALCYQYEHGLWAVLTQKERRFKTDKRLDRSASQKRRIGWNKKRVMEVLCGLFPLFLTGWALIGAVSYYLPSKWFLFLRDLSVLFILWKLDPSVANLSIPQD